MARESITLCNDESYDYVEHLESESFPIDAGLSLRNAARVRPNIS